MERIPINEYGDGNCCPICGSVKISMNYQYPLQVEEDLKTGKEILRDANGKRIYKPSFKTIARAYKLAQNDAQMWTFRCRKCGWASEPFVP